MSQIIVQVADCRFTDKAEDVLTTYALGSCIAVAVHDPVARVGGMLHYMLPESALDVNKASQNPFMFADTGIPLLFRGTYQRGAEKKRLTVQVAGGAQIMDEQGVFNIGKRNYLALRKILWKAGVMVHGEAVGGVVSRTIRLDMASGGLWIREGGTSQEALLASAAQRKGVENGLQCVDRR